MSLFNFLWDVAQESEIEDLKKEVKLLRADMVTLKEWIDYLNEKIQRLENESES